ncbi:MAG: DUF3592 domain-containing protein [Pseudomonadota bacterium]
MADAAQKSSGKMGGGCLTLFGSVFLLGGLVPGIFAGLMILKAWQARDWVPTRGTLTQVAVDVSTSDDGQTYQLQGRFRYRFDGQSYQSDQIDFVSGHDNIGDYHQDNYNRLRPLLSAEEALTVFVDPEDPSQAVVIRSLRWGLVLFLGVFFLVFGGVGAGIIGAGIWGSRKESESQQLADLHPEEPWRWEPDWEHGELTCSSKGKMWFAVGFAVFWNLISSAVWLFLPSELAAGNWVALVALVFPLAGLGLAAWAIVEVLRWRRYGRTTFVLESLPARLGDRLRGQVSISDALPANEVALRVSCLESRTSGSGKNRSTSTRVLWQDEVTAGLTRGPAGQRLAAVDFPLPADQPARDVSDSRHKIEWTLEAEASVPGPDLKASFDLPVFPGDMLAPLQNLGGLADPNPLPDAAEVLKSGNPEATGVVTDYRGGSLRYYFPPARHLAMGAGFTGAGLIAGAIAAGGATSGKMPWFAIGICGLLGTVFTAVGLNELMMRSEVRTRVGELALRRGWWLGRDRFYPLSEISGIELTDGMQAGNTRYYRLILKTRDGKSRVLAGGLKGRRNTEALAERLRSAVGLRDA